MKPLNKSVKSGINLFRENDRSRELYIIKSGRIKVYRSVANKEIELAILGKGSVLGEMALIDGKPRSASAKALEDCEVSIIDAETFFTGISDVPKWFLSIVKMVSQRIRNSNKRLDEVMDEKKGLNIVLILQYYCWKNQNNPEYLKIRRIKKYIVQFLTISSQRVVDTLNFLENHKFIDLSNDILQIKNKNDFDEFCVFIRYYFKGRFKKIERLSPQLEPLLLKIKQKYLKDNNTDVTHFEIERSEFEIILKNENITEDPKVFIEKFKILNLISSSMRAKDSSSNRHVLNLNAEEWYRYALFHQFQSMVSEL